MNILDRFIIWLILLIGMPESFGGMLGLHGTCIWHTLEVQGIWSYKTNGKNSSTHAFNESSLDQY